MRIEFEDGEEMLLPLLPLFQNSKITFSTLKANFLQELHLLDKAPDLSLFLDDFREKF